MSNDINELIKPVICNGEIVKHMVTDPNLEVENFFYFTYIEKENIIVKGTVNQMYESENALVVFFDLEAGKVKGRSNLLSCMTVTKRLWTDIEQDKYNFTRSLRKRQRGICLRVI